MHHLFRFTSLAALLIVTACGPTGPSEYLLGMMQYQGQSEAKVIDELGPPDRVYEVDNTKYLTYTKATQQIYNTTPDFGYGFQSRGRGLIASQNFGDTATIQTIRCDVFFAINNKRVTKVGHRGNAC